MTTLDLHPWNFMLTEILEHIFSFLLVRDRHNVSHTCKLWATAVSSALVWRFTEVHCNPDEIEEEDGGTSSSLLQMIQPYMGHIRYLKIVLDVSVELSRRLACTILDVMAQKSHRLQGLQIMCCGKCPLSYSGQDLLQSLSQLFHGMDEATMQHVDFCQVPFTLNNKLLLLVGSCSPNLRTLLINNHTPGLIMMRIDRIVEVLKRCPKLSTMRISYFVLTHRVFQEMLRPHREPFKYLELLYNGLDNDISDFCWALMRERHPSFRVGLEVAASVTTQKIIQVLKPHLPISHLCFHTFSHMADVVTLVANLYAGTLEWLVLHSPPSLELNMALIRLARSCRHLKEIHCLCVVGQEVVEAFRCHCPYLKKYTLSPTFFFFDNPPTVIL